MKFNNGILLTILIQLLLVYNPLPVVAQDLEEVVKRYTKSIWGNTELDSIRSLRTFGVVQNENGTPDFYFLQEMKPPDMIKNEYFVVPNAEGYTIAFDGEVGWERNTYKDSISTVRLSQERSKELSSNISIIEPFIRHKKNGVRVELIGKKKFGGGDNYLITVEFKDGKSKGYYIDSNGYQLNYSGDINSKSLELRFLKLTQYKNYRKVDGVFFPFLQKDIYNVFSKTRTFKILRIEVNPEFSENNFKMP